MDDLEDISLPSREELVVGPRGQGTYFGGGGVLVGQARPSLRHSSDGVGFGAGGGYNSGHAGDGYPGAVFIKID